MLPLALLLALLPCCAATYSTDVQEAAICRHFDGESVNHFCAGMWMMARSTIYNWLEIFEKIGQMGPAWQRNPAYLISPEHWDHILQAVSEVNTRYLREVAVEVLAMTGVLYTHQQLSRALARHRITRKLADVQAMEQDPMLQTAFAQILNDWLIEFFVSIDESALPAARHFLAHRAAPKHTASRKHAASVEWGWFV